MKLSRVSLLILAISVFPMVSLAAVGEGEEGLSTLAVQNRQHMMIHEFGVAIGTLPIDAFTKGLTFTGAYTIHFNDLLAWEIGQFTYSYRIDTALRDDLLQYDVEPTSFETVRFFTTSSLLLKPLYGKMAVMNRALVYSEIFIVAGGGWGRLSITDRAVVDVGLGLRIYAGKFASFRLDVRDYMFIHSDDVKNELWLGLSVCLGLGHRDSK
jgi:outer membrane beta-barrel protein